VEELRRNDQLDSEGGIGWVVKNDDAENHGIGVEYVVDSRHYLPYVEACRMQVEGVDCNNSETFASKFCGGSY
jgi:hypothetical protein